MFNTIGCDGSRKLRNKESSLGVGMRANIAAESWRLCARKDWNRGIAKHWCFCQMKNQLESMPLGLWAFGPLGLCMLRLAAFPEVFVNWLSLPIFPPPRLSPIRLAKLELKGPRKRKGRWRRTSENYSVFFFHNASEMVWVKTLEWILPEQLIPKRR